MSEAIIGFVGVVIGALVSAVGNWFVQKSQADSQTAAAVKAIARLTYDDFVHYQSTLVRALARGSEWWDDTEVLERQASVEDRKLLLGALADKPSQEVASAQGWMDYLLNRRKQMGTTQPTDIDLGVMRDTFCRLDRARRHLAESVSGWTYGSFDEGSVLESVGHQVTLADLGICDADCRARRERRYGREDPHPAAARAHDPLDDA